VFIKLRAESWEGYGEACLPAYLGETEEQTIAFLKKAARFLRQYDPVLPIHFFLDEIDALDHKCYAAKAALDIALHDLYGKIQAQSIAQMFGLEGIPPVRTSFTIGIDQPEKLRIKIEEAADFEVLKIKAGTADDKALLRLIREVTDKPLYVDVNQGWSEKEYVLEMLHWLKEQNVLLVEQPMPVAMKAEMQWVTERSPLPTFADESVKRLSDLQQLDDSFTGINIKLMKSTGLREALRMIQFCRKENLQIFLGCMAESSCGTSAMAQLLSYADFVDLDAPLLYTNDPFKGIQYVKGKVQCPIGHGIGAEPVVDLF
jgi:L-alanine-DL-glutamate epimerase-like enolase superfamily enzyme